MLRKLLFANFKLLYRLSQRIRRRFTSNGMMILMIMPVAGVFGFDTRTTLSFQIFSITLIMLVLSMAYAFFFHGKFSVARKLPDYGTVGIPVVYSCMISNKTKNPNKGLILIDDLKSQLPTLNEFADFKDPLDKKRNIFDRIVGYPRLVNVIQKMRGGSIKPVAIDYIAEESDININLELTPTRRGYVYFEKIRLAQTDPLGLFNAQKVYTKKDRLLILPKLLKTPKLKLYGKRTYQHGGINNASIVGDSQEFISLRDYRPGDPLRAIHWRSYAKRGEPIVKEYQDEYFVRYGLILDTYLNGQAFDLFEDAVSIAASLMSAQKDQDALLDLMFIGNNAYRFTSGRSVTDANNILEVLACIEPEQDSNIERLQKMIEQHIYECSALIFVLLALDEERQALIKNINQFNLPIKVLVVTDNIHEHEMDQIEKIGINYLKHDNLENDFLMVN